MAKHTINPNLTRLSLLDGADITLNALNGAAYYFGGIKDILTVAEKKWSEKGNFETSKFLNDRETNRLIWYTRSCFWELFAISDMMLQWANTRFDFGLKEDQVRWCDLKKKKKAKNLYEN